VALMGDAAHAMYPTGSNGASQAIIDARTIGAMMLDGMGVTPAALSAYDAALCGPVSELVLRNRNAGPFGLARYRGRPLRRRLRRHRRRDPGPKSARPSWPNVQGGRGLRHRSLNAAPPTIPDLGVSHREAVECRVEVVGGDVAGDADGDMAAQIFAADFQERRQLGDRAEDRGALRIEHLSGPCDPEFIGFSDDEALPRRCLQPFQRRRNCRLLETKKIRCPADAALLDDDHEGAQEIPVELPGKALFIGLHYRPNLC
jgi:hypothetical protein